MIGKKKVHPVRTKKSALPDEEDEKQNEGMGLCKTCILCYYCLLCLGALVGYLWYHHGSEADLNRVMEEAKEKASRWVPLGEEGAKKVNITIKASDNNTTDTKNDT